MRFFEYEEKEREKREGKKGREKGRKKLKRNVHAYGDTGTEELPSVFGLRYIEMKRFELKVNFFCSNNLRIK